MLFGGAGSSDEDLADTWVWDGTTWTDVSSPTSPQARRQFAMTYDELRQEVVLFGGIDNAAPEVFEDTWVWNGTTWSNKLVAGPGARAGHAMAYDAARGEVVLFGVYATRDTWRWNGTSWSLASSNAGPPQLSELAMTYDVGRQRVVLFGGVSNGQVYTGVFEWDGGAWTLYLPSSPRGRRAHGMAFDAARGVSVVFGGIGSPSQGQPVLNDTWTWNGSAWSDHSTAPSVRTYHASAFDPVSGGMLVFGGYNGLENLADTWRLDGEVWQPRHPVTSPSPRRAHAMAADAARDRSCSSVAVATAGTPTRPGSGTGPPGLSTPARARLRVAITCSRTTRPAPRSSCSGARVREESAMTPGSGMGRGASGFPAPARLRAGVVRWPTTRRASASCSSAETHRRSR